MKGSRFTETQVVSILKEADAGASVKEICRRHGISPATWHPCKSKCGGMGASERREAASFLVAKHGLSVARSGRAVRLPRATY